MKRFGGGNKMIERALITAGLVIGSSAASAETIVIYDFIGTFSEAIDTDLGLFTGPDGTSLLGNDITGSFSYDVDAVASVASYDGTASNYPTGGLSVQFSGGASGEVSSSSLFVVGNNYPDEGVIDFFGVFGTPDWSEFDDQNIFTNLYLLFIDPDANIFSDTSLPSSLPYDEFEQSRLNIYAFSAGEVDSLWYDIQIVTGGDAGPTPVPLPGSLVLTLGGIAAIGGLRRTSRRSRRVPQPLHLS